MSLKPMSLGEFAARLISSEADMRAAQEKAMERACKLVQRKARNMIGVEQPFWPALAPATIAEKARLGYRVPAPLLRTGEMRDSIQTDGPFWEGPKTVVGYVFSNSEIARWQELGTARIPPRPFLSTAAQGQAGAVANIAAAAMISALAGGHAFHAWKQTFERLHRAFDQAVEMMELDKETDDE